MAYEKVNSRTIQTVTHGDVEIAMHKGFYVDDPNSIHIKARSSHEYIDLTVEEAEKIAHALFAMVQAAKGEPIRPVAAPPF